MIKFLFTPLFCLISFLTLGQDYEGISNSFSTANTTGLSRLFDATVEVNIHAKEETLKKSDAEARLRTFFSGNQPKAFTIVHKGVSQKEIHYMIGQLTTATGTHRVTVYMHKSGEGYLIQSLEIEQE